MSLAIPITILLVATVGCGRPVEIVVPDGFTGEAHVVFDPANGNGLQSEGFKWVFRIPPEGEVRVRNQGPFYRWHKETVRHDDGTIANVTRQFTIAGARNPNDGRWESSTEFEGTTHVWVIAAKSGLADDGAHAR